jgi:hypothetical protein
VTSRFTSLSQPYNFTQIFKGEVNVTGTQEAVEKYGYSSEIEYQEGKRLKELAIQFERAFIYGRRNEATTNAQPASMMGGLWYYIYNASGGTANSDIIKDAGGATLTKSVLDGVMQALYGLGGSPDTLIVPPAQRTIISNWAEPYVQAGIDLGRVGTIVSRIESDFGVLNVVMNRYLKSDEMIVVTKEMLGIGPLTGRAWQSQPIAKRGDSEERLILGEYTAEIRGAGRAHGWLYNLATS